MTERQQIPWKRLIVEALAIVGSILLAFAIDAWWDERLERIDESEQLARLHVEFTENVERISERAEAYASLTAASRDAFEIIDAALIRGERVVNLPIEIVYRMLNARTFEADTPILDGLIRSGRLEIIEDTSLLGRVSTWERMLRDYTDFGMRARTTMDTHLIPAIAARADVGSVLMIEVGSDYLPQFGPDPTVTIEIDTALKTYVAERYRNGRFADTAFTRLKAAAEEVLTALDASQLN